MELKKKKSRASKDDAHSQVSIGNFSRSMTPPLESDLFLWRPHNYRRKIRIKLYKGSTIKKLKRTLLYSLGDSCTFKSSNELLWVSVQKERRLYKLQLGSEFLSCIHIQNVIGGEKEVYYVNTVRMMVMAEEIKQGMDEVLIEFVKKWGLFDPDAEIVWTRFEDWFRDEEFIDSIPKELIIHDKGSKKVYDEGWEFTGGLNCEPAVKVRNYINNRALENLTPELVNTINGLIERLDVYKKLTDPMSYLFDNNLTDWFNGLDRKKQDEFLGL